MQAAIHQNSSDLEPISNAGLTPSQTRIVEALAMGRTVTAAAQEASVHRTTIHHWLRMDPRFKQAVENSRREYAATLSDQIRDLAAHALETLRQLLDDPATPPSVRLKTALAVLQRPDQPGWNLAGPIESPPEQAISSGPILEQVVENAPDPATPRNASCPCGSGRKYKRCCGIASPPSLCAVPYPDGVAPPIRARRTTEEATY
jgi:hypothetical protein